jgi:hypothetical protein
MVGVTGLSERVLAEAGTGERVTSYVGSGTLSFWNGTGYTAVDLATGSMPASPTPQPVTVTYPGAGGVVVVTATPSVTIAAMSSTTMSCSPLCFAQPTHCTMRTSTCR